MRNARQYATDDVTDIRSVGVETINVHASAVTDGLNANTVAVDVHTQGITSNDIENSATIRTSDIHVSILSRPVLFDISENITMRCTHYR
jgi:hypothetical protein